MLSNTVLLEDFVYAVMPVHLINHLKRFLILHKSITKQ